MGKGKAPKTDERIGEAAMKSAQTGENYLSWMQDQAAITNKWAAEDRTRYKTVFEPLQDQYIEKAQTWDNPERMAARVNATEATARGQADLAGQQRERQLASMGVRPDAGKYGSVERTAALQGNLAIAGAGNLERRTVRAEGEQMRANAINLGSGGQVNPGTSIGLSNGAAQAGFSGAMQGYGQQGDLLNTQYQQQMQQYQAQQQQGSSFWGGVGSIVGLAFGSDEAIKKDKKPPRRSLLEAVDQMPVEEWTYKPGKGDGGTHVGTYAQDFKKQTGMGDGKSINVIDALGVTMGAVKELSAKVDAMSAPQRRSIA